MWQTKYAAAVPKNLGVGVNFRPCSEGYFLSGRPQSVDKSKVKISQNFVAFSEYMNFTTIDTNYEMHNATKEFTNSHPCFQATSSCCSRCLYRLLSKLIIERSYLLAVCHQFVKDHKKIHKDSSLLSSIVIFMSPYRLKCFITSVIQYILCSPLGLCKISKIPFLYINQKL